MASPDLSPASSCPPGNREVTKELLQTVLSNYHRSRQTDIEIYDWTSNEATGNRQGFLSEQARVSVRYVTQGKELEVQLLFKFLPEDPGFREYIRVHLFVQREVKFYTEILPVLKNIEKTCLSEEDLTKSWVPTFFYGKFDKWRETSLVLENMSPYGYSVGDFNTGLTYAEAKSALISIANFHALSLALEVKEGQLLQERFPFLYPVEKAVDCFSNLAEKSILATMKLFDSRTDLDTEREILVRYLEKNDIRVVLQKLMSHSSKLNTLLHFDFWCNNILFKYDGENVHTCIIDWQMVTYGCPAKDVSKIIWSSLAPQDRRQYGQTLQSDYWHAFTRRLEKLGIETQKLGYTKDDFYADLKIADLLAVVILILCTSMNTGYPRLEERNVEAIVDSIKDGLIFV